MSCTNYQFFSLPVGRHTQLNYVLQGNSEKCTGAFKFGCRVIFYSSKSCRKSGLISHLSNEFPQKIFKL